MSMRPINEERQRQANDELRDAFSRCEQELMTWPQIQAVIDGWRREHDMPAPDCDCTPATVTACPACRSAIREAYGDGIPFEGDDARNGLSFLDYCRELQDRYGASAPAPAMTVGEMIEVLTTRAMS